MPVRHFSTRISAIEALETRRLLAFNPTADEQYLLQLINRFRTDPQGEFARLIASTSPLVARDSVLQIDLDYAQVNGPALKSQLASLSPLPPLAWNGAISNFATGHNAQMIATNPPQQFHSNTLQRRQALLDAGVNLRFREGEKINAENVYGHGKSVLHTYGSFVIDWQRGAPNGMQTGHRSAIMNADYDQIGHAITPYAGSNFGPLVTTQVLANIENPPVMAVGAVFEDRNSSGWYEAGEGIGGVQLVFRGAAGSFTTTSLSAGGYQIELPPGTYQVTATGGGMKHAVLGQTTVGSSNVWKNLVYDPTTIPPAPPVAELDRAVVSSISRSTTIDLIANDRDPDGNAASLVPQLSSGTPSAFSLAGSTLTYTAPVGFGGVHRATYTVRDQQGLVSQPGTVEIFVTNLSSPRPWQNPVRPSDVNADGLTTPLDALLIVNQLNSRGAGELSTSVTSRNELFGFLDSSGDGFLSALDVLLVVNFLNASSGEAEGESRVAQPAPAVQSQDLALAQMYAGATAYQADGNWTDQPALSNKRDRLRR